MSWRSAALPPLVVLSAFIALMLLDSSRAQQEEKEPEVVLPACGIRYPGGYDPNTVGIVEGRVASFSRPGQGPVSFRIESAGESFTVLAAPSWYWEEQKVTVRDGDRVRVKGSKTMGADGSLYVVAQEITLPGREKPLTLRDAGGKPLWRGCGPKGCGMHGR
jgi:hypothetical protein